VAEQPLEPRLLTVARALDADAPAFEVGRLRSTRRRRLRGHALALALAVIAAAAVAAPAAVSALRDVFAVDEVPAIGALEYGVAPPYAGRSVPLEVARADAPFRLRTIRSLGAPYDARVRDDVVGGLVTLVYRRDTWILLTQWPTADVSARIAVVPVAGRAEHVTVGSVPALWVEGAARGTLTLVGADGTLHRESFEVGAGALLWRRGGMTFLLQGTASREDAIRLAAEVAR
jgi:hypothetical protein